ncbi:MAG: YceI family protein [Bacteroidetes bacterium]|nr:YceI family protein [Bacteroidota bacterium]
MKTKILLSIALFTLSIAYVNSQTVYKADLNNSKLSWLGKKITGEHHGSINLSSGEITVKQDMITKAEFKIDMASLKDLDLTDDGYKAKLEGHLKSDDFFGVEKFPVASFVMDKLVKIQKGNTFITGKMTIKGVTQPITFKAVITQTGDEVKVYASITIDRTKFNIKYGSGSFFDNLGDKTIYDEFTVTLNLSMKK